MKCVKSIASLPDIKETLCLAIGTFDGVHLGHVELIRQMKKIGKTLVFTFCNHPTDVLIGNKKVPSLTSPKQKQTYLEKAGIDYCVIQPFTQDIAQMPYNLFLEEVYSTIPFSHIFFGQNDGIGKNRAGTPEKVQEIGDALGFKAHYLKKEVVNSVTVSSTEIRKALKEGNLPLAEKLLGRPFSFEVSTDDPYLDANLLKEGRYLVHLQSTKAEEFNVVIDKLGNIHFEKDSLLPNPKESEILIFNSR